jgi:oligoendopeptidase F
MTSIKPLTSLYGDFPMIQSKVTRVIITLILAGLIIMTNTSISLAQTKTAPTRDQIDAKNKWKLTDIFPSDEAWEQALISLKEAIPSFKKYEGKLGSSSDMLVECLILNDTLGNKVSRLWLYSNLKGSEDTRIGKYQEMTDKYGTVAAQFNQVTSFIDPEILAIPDQTLKSYIETNPKLAVYRFYLEDLLRRKAHVMSPEVEDLLAMAGNVTRGFINTFSMIDDADIKYPSIKDENGNEVEITKQRYSLLIESTDRRVRKDASDAYNKAYVSYINTLGSNLSSSLRSDYFYAKARKYNTALERSLDANNIPTSVFHNLIKSVNNNLTPLHKYVALRKKMLKLDTMYTYDMWVPLVPEAKMEFPDYEKAKELVLDALKPLGKEYLGNVKTALESGWVDVFETQGKEGGAYSAGVYGIHPYVLLNYVGSLDNVFTLSHELGHAMHTYYSNKYEPMIYSGHSLFTAEVASTCNEAIMIQYLINKTKDKTQKMYLINYYINQILGTFYGQGLYSEFELRVHEIVESGGSLSAESMRKIYREIYEKYYGPDLVMEPEKDMGALRVYHFYRQYYVYQYATSYAASQLLSTKILNGEKGAMESYEKFISTGSSDYPVNILKKAGIDMTTSEPFDNVGLLFSSLVDQLENLLQEK